jgi:glycosyltransferase involved in cell wall biosynthesis
VVTAVIPTRNRRDFLEQSVRDALGQVDVDVEVLIVDDGSTSVDAVAGIEALDDRVRVIREDRHRGVAHARNVASSHARGEWLAFLDDDDRWAPTKLREQLAAARAAGAQWVYCAAATIDKEDRVLFVTPPDRPATQDWLGIVNPVPGGCSNVVARTDLVRAVGGFDENLALLADWDLWIRLAAKAQPAATDDVLVAYRLHPGNMHVRDAAAVDAELDYFVVKHETNGDREHHDLRVSLALPWQAKAHRRAGHPVRAARLFFRRWRVTREARDLAHAVISLFGEPAIQVVRRRWTRGKVGRVDWLDGRAS